MVAEAAGELGAVPAAANNPAAPRSAANGLAAGTAPPASLVDSGPETTGRVSELDGAAPGDTDFANYFCTYAFLYHQKDMLEDAKRTGAYYNAVMQNRQMFEGRTVLDVGTGSGILAIFAANAGAKKVYAVEATNMAKHAAQLVQHNGLSHVITVIQGTIETVKLPEKVDMIISEWMGYFLLRESMLDSVLVARDRFLAPGGSLWPSHARMFFAPIRNPQAHRRAAEYESSMAGWSEFVQDMQGYYGVDMDCLSRDFDAEQQEYFLNTSSWADVHPSQLVGPPTCFKEYDLRTVTAEEIAAPLQASFTLDIVQPSHVEGFVGFFDVQFRGSPENPAEFPLTLSTAPDPTGATHWGQQAFTLHPPRQASAGDRLECSLRLERKKENHRLMEVALEHAQRGRGVSAQQAARRLVRYHIE